MDFSEADLTTASEWIKYWTDIFTSNLGAAESAESAFCPPEPSPDEQPVAGDPEFLSKCRADVVAMCGGAVVWEDQLVTRSPTWGLVWRADYWDPSLSNPLYPSRVACWKNDAGESGMTVSALQHDKLTLKG
jgi:hypothetical protein